MRSWKSHRLTNIHGLGLNPQIGRPLSSIIVPMFKILNFFDFAENKLNKKHLS
jgi:hypothetical protein